MPEYVAQSIEAMQNAFKRMPRDAAEKLAMDAAIRAEAVADYVELVSGGKEEKKE